MNKKLYRFLACLCLLVSISIKATEQLPIQIYTDSIPPLSFVNALGKMDGTVYQDIKSVLDVNQIEFQVTQAPWSRALQLYRTNPRALIYPITRTKVREDKFQWLMPLFKHSYNLYALRSKFANPETEIDVNKHKFLCVDNEIGCAFLREQGVPDQSIITISSINVQKVISMLKKDRIDFAYIAENGFNYKIKELGLELNHFSIMPGYSREIMDYLVTHPSHQSDEITKIQQAVIEKTNN